MPLCRPLWASAEWHKHSGGRRVGEPAMVARQFVVIYSEQPSRQTDADHGIYRECFDEADVIAHLAANVIEVG